MGVKFHGKKHYVTLEWLLYSEVHAIGLRWYGHEAEGKKNMWV